TAHVPGSGLVIFGEYLPPPGAPYSPPRAWLATAPGVASLLGVLALSGLLAFLIELAVQR
ncbi:MAG: hypothetical protein ACRDQZ_14730, partial [Mycobacteriales bacterium]